MKKISKIKFKEKIKNICIKCMLPVILVAVLLIIVFAFGVKISNNLAFLFLLVLCPLMHFFMTKDMHKNKDKNKCH